MNNLFIRKQAANGKVKAIAAMLDSQARRLGRVLGAGKSAGKKIESVKRVAKGTGAFQDPYLRSGVRPYAEELLNLRNKQKLAERLVGYGLPVLTTGGLTAYALSGDDEKQNNIITSQAADTNTVDSSKSVNLQTSLEPQKSATADRDSSLLRNLGIYGGSAAAGGAIGAYADRRNRLRGFLLGATAAPMLTAAADYLYQTTKNKA